MHPAQAPLNQGLNHPELKIINFLNLRKIRLYDHCAIGFHFRKIETDKSRSENSPNSPRRINRYHFKFQSNEPDKNNFKIPHITTYMITVFRKWQNSENPQSAFMR
jgi:hypothetical protein